MSALLSQLQQQIAGQNLDQIARTLGVDQNQATTAVAAALPTLLAALGRNAGSAEGAESLHRAVVRDHDGSLLDQLGGFLGGGGQPNAGAGILRHVLGERQSNVQQNLGRATGLSSAQIGSLLVTLAPMVMAALGKMQRQRSLDAGGLATMLGGEAKQMEQTTPGAMGLLGSLLDSDGDGDFDLGDIAKKGLGGLFGGR